MALADYLGGGKVAPTQSMPGQLEAIAQQLARGYGGMQMPTAPQAGDYLSWLKNLHGSQDAPAPTSPTPTPTPTKPGVKPFQDMSVPERWAQMGHGVMAGNQWVPPQIAPWMQDRGRVAAGMGMGMNPQPAPQPAPQVPKAPMTNFASIFNQARTINRGGSR